MNKNSGAVDTMTLDNLVARGARSRETAVENRIAAARKVFETSIVAQNFKDVEWSVHLEKPDVTSCTKVVFWDRSPSAGDLRSSIKFVVDPQASRGMQIVGEYMWPTGSGLGWTSMLIYNQATLETFCYRWDKHTRVKPRG